MLHRRRWFFSLEIGVNFGPFLLGLLDSLAPLAIHILNYVYIFHSLVKPIVLGHWYFRHIEMSINFISDVFWEMMIGLSRSTCWWSNFKSSWLKVLCLKENQPSVPFLLENIASSSALAEAQVVVECLEVSSTRLLQRSATCPVKYSRFQPPRFFALVLSENMKTGLHEALLSLTTSTASLLRSSTQQYSDRLKVLQFWVCVCHTGAVTRCERGYFLGDDHPWPAPG